jgi:hypothetical protein
VRTRLVLHATSSLALLAAIATACGSDPPADAIADRAEWCAVIADVDEQFAAADSSTDSFEAKQTAYAEIRVQVARLAAAIDLVDESARADVADGLAFATDLTSALVDAADEQAAEAALGPIYEGLDGDVTGGEWVLDECGVDING